MATEFTTEFDGTDGAAANLTTVPGFSNRTGANGWFFETSDKASGTASIHCVNDAPNTSVWTYTHTAGGITTRYYDISWQVTALPASDCMVYQIRLGGTNKAQLEIRADGTVRMKNGTTAVGSSAAGTVVAGQWLRLKWGINGTNQELRIYTSPTGAGLYGTPPDQTLGAGVLSNYTGGDWDQFRLGVLSAVDLEIWLDRLVIDNSTWPASGGSGNTPPTADAGPDQDSVIGGDTVTLDGTGSSDPDGTIAAYEWVQTVGPTVDLSDDTDDQPTFVAPDNAGSATFQLRVTDDDGAQSAPDTVVITWSDVPDALPTSDFYERLLGGGNGVALTAGGGSPNTNFDSVDAGLTFLVPSITHDIGEPGLTGAFQFTGTGAVKVATRIIPAGLVSQQYVDFIAQIDNLVAGPWYLCRALSGSTLRASVRVNTDGSIQMRNGTSATPATGTVPVTQGEPFRVAWHLNNGTGQDLRLFLGSNIYNDGSSPSDTLSGALNTGTFDRIGFGIAAPAVASGHGAIAIPQVDASDWPEPYGMSTQVLSGLYLINEDGTFSPLTLTVL